MWKIIGIWDTHKIAPSDSPCGRTKYGTSVWKRDYAYKCVSLILPRDTGNAKCKLCAREAGQEMDKIHGYIHKPKFDHSPFPKWINSTCMGLITPIPMPQEYNIGAQSGPCNTQVHRTRTILGGPLTQTPPCTPIDSHSRCGKKLPKCAQVWPCYLKKSSDNNPNMGHTGLIWKYVDCLIKTEKVSYQCFYIIYNIEKFLHFPWQWPLHKDAAGPPDWRLSRWRDIPLRVCNGIRRLRSE